MVDDGRFPGPGYTRVIRIEIPPLRERREDIPLLAEHFLEEFQGSMSKSVRGFTPQAMDRLVAYGWPGNVRDLRREVERAVAMADADAAIDVSALSAEVQGHSAALDQPLARESLRTASRRSRDLVIDWPPHAGNRPMQRRCWVSADAAC
jgi:DNA-binding NtrC family response regulator